MGKDRRTKKNKKKQEVAPPKAEQPQPVAPIVNKVLFVDFSSKRRIQMRELGQQLLFLT
jgi:hypothetical protein